MISNMLWLALNIYFEARGEPFEGQVAVAHVVLNRVEKSGTSVKTVVNKPWQFSWLNSGNRPAVTDYEALATALKAAYSCLEERMDGKDLWGADHYYAYEKVNPSWARGMRMVIEIGGHRFFKS